MKKTKIDHYTDKEALDFHSKNKPGKIEINSSKPMTTKRDLALAYSPGVAVPVQAIADNPENAYDYTSKGNLVAVISNGSAILGLGNLGAIASKPVMEGKAVLFKRFADIDAIDLEIDSKDPEEIVNSIKNFSVSFGGINLEDIAAPECFIIEENLKKILDIPVFHDDQHGTAIITSAALINSIHITKKNISKVKVVVNGAGASAMACSDLFLKLGVKKQNLTMIDSKGVISLDRKGLNKWKLKYAKKTNDKTLSDALKNADVFLGLSSAGILKKEGNVMAIRVVDITSVGGFRGSIFLNSDNEKQRLDQGTWKQKHHAFYLYPSLQLHNLSTNELIAKEEALKANLKTGLNLNNPNNYSILFEKMLTPVMPYGIRGALWYQGESNVNNFQDYQELFSEMIRDWRSSWDYEFPFYFVQIAPYIYSDSEQSYALRDAQRKSLSTPKTGMAITLDIGEEYDIHPANKLDVGLRLARLALHNDYGKKEIVPSGPLYRDHKILSNFIEIEFDDIGSGLFSKNGLKGFEIAGDDGKFVPGKAKIIGNTVLVSSSTVKTPKRVRYGWSNYFEATLFNKEGLPASSFQTN